MRSVTVRLDDLRTTILNLGFVGENEHKTIRFDSKKMFDEYPGAAASLTVVPPAGEAYPAIIERDGDIVAWTITDSDLISEGDGEIQLSFTSGETVAKTYIGRTRTCRALVPTGEIPSGLDDFLTRAGAILDEVEDAIPEGGTTGQVLAKKSNDDYDMEWVDQIGGGGGTSDYDQLNNRPQIGGVTLTGNKSLHDLGAATEEAVGAKYTKPESGIPAADMAEGVIPDPTSIIDDTAGDGDTNKTWSADKLNDVKSEISQKQDAPSATGTAGQALVLDNNLHPVWGDVNIDPEDIAEAVDDWLDEHPEAVTTVEDDSITRAKLNGNLKAASDTVTASLADHGLKQYFYKADTYINNSLQETSLNGVDLYKIPVSFGDIVEIKQVSGESNFWGTLNKKYALRVIYNGSYSEMGIGYDAAGNFTFLTSARTIKGYAKLADYSALMLCIINGNESNITVSINSKEDVEITSSMFAEKDNFPFKLTSSNCIVNNVYPSNNTVTTAVSPYTCYVHTIKENDRLYFGRLYSGLSNYGVFVAKDDSATSNIQDNPFIAPEDGYVCCFVNESDMLSLIYVKNGLTVDYSQIINSPDSPFSGMNDVAFGTSLTYRAITSNGYLDYLPDLSGMTFDNQGVGSSVILGDGGNLDMLAIIKGYSSYSGKQVCTIEGFCNDWYQNKTLGTWKDTGETTVCGCVRSALNYILSQNANLTVFLILDPYGKDINGVDSSSTAENASNLTQYEYYEEIAKVANSLAIPVIKQYAESQISENTPQYMTDNIHPTASGALQSARFIWSKMKQYYANNVSGT